MVATHFFGKRYKNRGFRGLKKPVFFGKKWWNYFLPVFKAPHFLGVIFVWAFFFLLLSVSSASSKRVCKKTFFIGFFAHPSKASSDIMQQQGSKAKTPQKKGAQFFFLETPFLTNFFKNTNFAPPPENCAQKISRNPYFIGSKMVAKLLTQRWPSY